MIELRGPLSNSIDRATSQFAQLREIRDRIAQLDPLVFGSDTEAPNRLGWVNAPSNSRTHLKEIAVLVAKFAGKSEVILSGMGGSSLAPEVIAATFKKKLFVLDSTDPDYIARALTIALQESVIVIGSKSGSTIETASHKALLTAQLQAAGLNPSDHIVIVTDPGSPLDTSARSEGLSVINADPTIGGRFSALSAFGLVPAALLGIDIESLLKNAAAADAQIRSTDIAVDLAYLLLTQTKEYFALVDSVTAPGLPDWIEQLVAESTGKSGIGRLPVVVDKSGTLAAQYLEIGFSSDSPLNIAADLPSQFLLWEWATAILGAALKIDPFNQPNVTEAKAQTSALLSSWSGALPHFLPDEISGDVERFGLSMEALIAAIPSDGYLAIMAYVDRIGQSELIKLREFFEARISKPVTFGWGPRFLHSTGQFHKGGPAHGGFLQITGAADTELVIPGVNYSFETLEMAQALGDNRALTERKLPVTRLHLRTRKDYYEEITNFLQR